MVAAGVTVQAVRLLRSGAAILRRRDLAAAARSCGRTAEGGLLGLLGVAALYGLMMVLPIPGRFGALIYLVMILGPVGSASLILLVVGVLARALMRR